MTFSGTLYFVPGNAVCDDALVSYGVLPSAKTFKHKHLMSVLSFGCSF